MHLWRVFVLEIPRNLTCSSSFCKVTSSKPLISMKQDSARKKFEGEHYCKSQLLNLLKRKNPHGCFHKLATYWKWMAHLTISWKFSAENHCDWRQIRSEQTSFCVTVLKRCSVVLGILRHLVLKINITSERTGHNA